MEPNDAMRENGIKRTVNYKNVNWFEGVGEDTRQPTSIFDLVTFGSSFNVTNRQDALKESQRILKQNGWFACLWNRRDLSDPIQQEVETIIKSYIKNYDYGTRREDQTEIIKESGRFDNIQPFGGRVIHSVLIDDFIEGWHSHATLLRQAGNNFSKIIKDISDMLKSMNKATIDIPYQTQGWMAHVIK